MATVMTDGTPTTGFSLRQRPSSSNTPFRSAHRPYFMCTSRSGQDTQRMNGDDPVYSPVSSFGGGVSGHSFFEST